MAINLKDFKKTKYPNLYKGRNESNNDGYKYLLWAKIDKKLHKKILGYSKKDNLTDRSANLKANAYKKEVEEGYNPNKTIKLDTLCDLYFEGLKDTDWNTVKRNVYNRYIKQALGQRNIDSIKEMHINKIIINMSKQGLKPRTQKTIIEVLKPMFNFAVKNKIIRENPAIDINVKVPSQKKLVTNATELFRKLYTGITEYYKDNPYYKALFLFGFTGRRKGEILNLKWENIDFTHNYYWIEDTKTDDQQKYELPYYLIEALQEIKDDRKGLVFKSPVTGKALTGLHRQMEHLKKYTGIENLSMHYMRNIIVSALAEQGTEAITLSGILGHKDPNTINKYLSINHYKSSQIGLDKIDDILDVEVIDDA